MSACGPSAQNAEVPAPEGELLVALLVLAEGGVDEATGLVTWAPDAPLPLVAPAGRNALVVGWSTEALQAVGLLDAARTGASMPLEAAGGCAPRLPPPSFAASWPANSTLIAQDIGAVPPLTASWLANICDPAPDPSLETALELRCGLTAVERCETVVTPVPDGRCTLRIDTRMCDLGSILASRDWRGETCLDFSRTRSSCTPRETDARSDAAYQCTIPRTEGRLECAVDFYFDAMPPMPFELARARLLDVPYALPNQAERSLLYPGTVSSGYAHDVLPMDGVVLVSVRNDGRQSGLCPYEERTTETRLQFRDAETLELLRTATVPDCLQRLAPDPIGGGFFGTYLLSGRFALGRFDPSADLVQTATTGLEARLPDLVNHRVIELATIEEQDLVVILLTLQRSELDADAILLGFDTSTLALRFRFDVEDRGVGEAMAVAGDRRVAIVWPDFPQAAWIDIVDRALAGDRIEVPDGRSFLKSMFEAYVPEGSRRLLVGARGDFQVVSFEQNPDRVETLTSFDESIVALDFAPWQPDPSLLLVAGTIDFTWRATITLLDHEALRFLPGTYVIGEGVASRMRADAAGRVWMLLPWSAELVRLSPR